MCIQYRVHIKYYLHLCSIDEIVFACIKSSNLFYKEEGHIFLKEGTG